jgi:hypothetical protein
MKKWGGTGAFWGGLWGLLLGSAFFFIPGVVSKISCYFLVVKEFKKFEMNVEHILFL